MEASWGERTNWVGGEGQEARDKRYLSTKEERGYTKQPAVGETVLMHSEQMHLAVEWQTPFNSLHRLYPQVANRIKRTWLLTCRLLEKLRRYAELWGPCRR